MIKNYQFVIVNVNLQIPVNASSQDDAIEQAENYELPKEYIEDSYEFVKCLDGNEDEIEE